MSTAMKTFPYLDHKKRLSKRRLPIIMPILVTLTVILTFTECDKIICTKEFRVISLTLQYPDGQPVLLDSSKVFWVGKKRYLEQRSWSEEYGHYLIVDDVMQKELQNKKETMRFTGYLNGEIVCERDVPVSADRCHVKYIGKESRIQVIQYQNE
jgi:hypothetical protein